MQNLNRFVTYVYSYRDYERDVNVGFAKVDCRGELVRMEIQIRRKKKGEREEMEVYLLAENPKNPLAIPVGSMDFERETGTYQGRLLAKDIGGSGYGFDQITGLYLKNKKEVFASQWIEEDLNLREIRFFKKEDVEEKESQPEDRLEVRRQESGIAKESQRLSAAQLNQSREISESLKGEEDSTLKAMAGNPLYDWRYEWEKLDQGPDKELVLGIALWTRNKGKS